MKYPVFIILCVSLFACQVADRKSAFTGKKGEVRLVTLAPGHFHAALIQKEQLPQINDKVYVYSPKGTELDAHLSLISSYNERADHPTRWEEVVYQGEDFLDKMLTGKKGNVVILAGDNRKKLDYIQKSIQNGMNVLADKPLIIQSADFAQLEQVVTEAAQKNLMIYDIMTERYDLIHQISRQWIHDTGLFGDLLSGTAEEPAIEMESKHHFFKEVSGKPLIRPAWFYDVDCQGEGIVDVTTHLIDLIQWKCFPDEIINYRKDIRVEKATHWATKINAQEFEKSTQLPAFPPHLQKYVKNNLLYVNANGTLHYTIKNVHIAMKVGWDFEAPEGTGDIHRTIIRGTKASIHILQGKEEEYKSKLYVKNNGHATSDVFLEKLEKALQNLNCPYRLSLKEAYNGMFEVVIPPDAKKGHEEHFSKVAQKFFDYLVAGRMPEWEIQGMLAKYYVTTRSLEIAQDAMEPSEDTSFTEK